MAGLENWIREFRFSATASSGNFEVGAAGGATQPMALHCSFSFQKSDLAALNTGRVTLWNLTKEQKAILRDKSCTARFSAGYGGRVYPIFQGLVSKAVTSMDGADRKTEIEIVDELASTRDTYTSVSYQGKVGWKQVIDDAAGAMGIPVDYSYNAEFSDLTDGFSYVGKAWDVMERACNSNGLSYSIQDGVLHVKKAGDVMNPSSYLLSAETGLIGMPVEVIETSGVITFGVSELMGWDVEYLLNPAINIDDLVQVQCPTLNGAFRVYSLQMSGDNSASEWKCKARIVELS